MGCSGEFSIDTIITEVTGGGASDLIQQPIDRFRLYKLPNGRKRHVIESHMEFSDQQVCQFESWGDLPVQMCKITVLDHHSELNSTSPMVNPLVLWVFHHLQVGITMVLCKMIGGKEIYSNIGHCLL